MENKDQPAFPQNIQDIDLLRALNEKGFDLKGLKKREYFAGHATVNELWQGEGYTQEYATNITGIEPPTDKTDKKAWHLYWLNVEAVIKIQKADALLTQLNSPK